MKILSSFCILLFITTTLLLLVGAGGGGGTNSMIFTKAQSSSTTSSTAQQQLAQLQSIQAQYAVPQWPYEIWYFQGCQDPYFIIHESSRWDMQLRNSGISIADQVARFAGNFSDVFGSSFDQHAREE